MYVYNGVIQPMWLTNQLIRRDVKCTRVCSSTTIFIYIGVTLLAVNRSTEEIICASGRLASYLRIYFMWEDKFIC